MLSSLPELIIISHVIVFFPLSVLFVKRLGHDGMRDRNGNAMPIGAHPAFHWNRCLLRIVSLKTSHRRYLKQWVVVWNGWDGRIYISSSPTLGDRVFEAPRVLVDRANNREKNWWAFSELILFVLPPSPVYITVRHPCICCWAFWSNCLLKFCAGRL